MAHERKSMIEPGSILRGPDTLERVISRDRLQSGRAALNPASEETTQERNNEGNFITSYDKSSDVSELPIKEDMGETSKQVKSKASEQPKKKSSKLSLKQAVLEEGKEQEEKITKTRLNVDIDEDLHFWLKGHAIQNRRKLNDLIPRILKAYRDQVEEDL